MDESSLDPNATREESTRFEASIACTIDHIRRLGDKQRAIFDAQQRAEERFVQAVACAYRAGLIDVDKLADIYAGYREVATSGMRARWESAVGVSVGWLRHYRTARDEPKWKPNGPSGSFIGEFPFGDDAPRPKLGTSVVYVLFDGLLSPCYVGSTDRFQYRIRAHARDGKVFERWAAYPCRDREAAYELEDQLLRQHKPYLNRRAGR